MMISHSSESFCDHVSTIHILCKALQSKARGHEEREKEKVKVGE